MAGFLELETRLVKSNIRIAAELRHLVEVAMPDGSVGRDPSLRGIPDIRRKTEEIGMGKPYWKPFLYPQPEDAPCRVDRDPRIMELPPYAA